MGFGECIYLYRVVYVLTWTLDAVQYEQMLWYRSSSYQQWDPGAKPNTRDIPKKGGILSKVEAIHYNRVAKDRTRDARIQETAVIIADEWTRFRVILNNSCGGSVLYAISKGTTLGRATLTPTLTLIDDAELLF
jgi:hypothetical protein